MSKKTLTQKLILVTGGAGFVGSHLCEALAKQGHKVISLDNYFTGSQANHVPGVEYREAHTKDIERHVPETPDIIYHLGEYSRVEQSFDDLPLVWEHNKNGTFSVLEFWRKRGSKLVYAGSSTKFADGGLGRSLSPYAWTKASNTELVRNYASWFNLPYATVYFYNVYGGREISSGRYATLIALFKEKYRRGEPFNVVAPGTQQRNFTHVEDIVGGLVRVGEQGEGDDFGIGHERSYSILEVAKLFGDHPVEFLPERAGNRTGSVLVAEKTRALGWETKHDLEVHIKEFVQNVVRQ